MTTAPTRLAKPSAALLFDDLPAVWHVWYRPERAGVRWALVGSAATYGEAVALIGTGGRHGGDWLVTDRPGRPLAKGGYAEAPADTLTVS